MQVKEVVHQLQCKRSIRRAATQASPHGYMFVQVDLKTGQTLVIFFEQLFCFQDQVVFGISRHFQSRNCPRRLLV